MRILRKITNSNYHDLVLNIALKNKSKSLYNLITSLNIMIEVTIIGATEDSPLKTVYFRNTKGWIIRESYYNPTNELIVEEMVEFDDKNKISRQVLFLTAEYKTIEEKQKMIETAKSYLSENDAAISNDATEMEILSQALHQHMKNLKTLNSQNQ